VKGSGWGVGYVGIGKEREGNKNRHVYEMLFFSQQKYNADKDSLRWR